MNRQEYLSIIDEVNRNGSYKPNWDSLAEHPVPEWYRKLRLGIFIHWGVYTVPEFDNEWYSRNMYMKGSKAYEHHIATYGAHNKFGYKDFIPLFTADRFDAGEWARLFKRAGAQYIMPVAEHHDGFQMYKSELSHWNAYEMGPKRDVLGELKAAVENEGMEFGASTHRAEHWFFMSHGREFDSDVKEPMQLGDFYWPAQPEGALHDMFSLPAPNAEYLDDWLLRCCELVDAYRPKLIYFDWWIQHSAFKPYLQRFAAYYYNRGEEWGTGCVIHYKHDAFPFGCAVPDVERGQFAEAKPYPWQSDTAIARNSWCYTEGNDFKSAKELVQNLIDIVSKNGRLLLNVGPRASGEISPEDTAVLSGIGDWLAVNGEAVYDAHVWRMSAEGPTEAVEGQFSDGKPLDYTSKDIRYTCNGSRVYATVLEWNESGAVDLTALRVGDASKLPLFNGIIRRVEALGHDGELSWSQDEAALHISAPHIKSGMPVVIRITID